MVRALFAVWLWRRMDKPQPDHSTMCAHRSLIARHSAGYGVIRVNKMGPIYIQF